YPRPSFESVAQVLKTYDEGVAAARATLAAASDGEFMVPWTLKNGGQKMFSMPRVGVFRSFILNHTVHHRGQLSVDLRTDGGYGEVGLGLQALGSRLSAERCSSGMLTRGRICYLCRRSEPKNL